jgi:lipopolysaccharide transport system ATP-binding protein
MIEAEGLSKKYVIGGPVDLGYRTLRDSIAGLLRRPWTHHDQKTIWALKDVSFTVAEGETVGIIGRNGAGKSTLLKILSRITEPTTGRARLRGRLASMLEVGTGFHPELTGRENIYLNGAILGMTRAEIKRKFAQIVDFSEIEEFIDTPVKRYSSGMYVRLAFAVAAHLEPEILIVDEVLSVGDASFQKKCLAKMEQIGREGRTVLFVSHNLTALARLCPRAILLEHGAVSEDGPAHQVVHNYLRSDLATRGSRVWPESSAPGNEVVRLISLRARRTDGSIADSIDIREPVSIEVELEVLQSGHVLVPNFHVFNEDGLELFIAQDLDPAWRRRPRPAGRYRASAHVPGDFWNDGTIMIGVAVSTMDPVIVHVYEPDAIGFDVIDSFSPDSARGDYTGPMPGAIRPVLRWTNEVLSHSDTTPDTPQS